MTYSYDRTAATAKQVLDLEQISTKAKNAIWDLDDKYIGTDDYMGVAFFWDPEYKWELREANPKKRKEVHDAFRKAKLKPDGVSDEHEAIIVKMFGKR